MLEGRIVVTIVKAAGALRDRLVARLETQPDLFVAAIADRAVAGRAHVLLSRPDVVLANAALGGNDALDLVASIAADAPATRVIVIDVPATRNTVMDFLKAGARGLVAKDAPIGIYERAIRSVAAGAYVVPPELIGVTRPSWSNGHADRLTTPAVLSSVHMTQREREIATLLVTGASDEEISTQLAMTPDTFDSHIRNILEKLVLHTRLHIAALATPTRPGRVSGARVR